MRDETERILQGFPEIVCGRDWENTLGIPRRSLSREREVANETRPRGVPFQSLSKRIDSSKLSVVIAR